MSIADFVLAFVGIIIGLGVADLLGSVHKLLRAGRQVKWHWATPALAILMLLVTLILWWWSFIWFSSLRSESIVGFLPKFSVLVVAFLMMAAALPDDIPDDGIDLKAFYESSRIHLWSLMSVTLGGVIVIFIADNWALGVLQLLVLTAFPLISFVFAIIAARTPRMWVHALAIGWIFAASVYNNLFRVIGQ